MAENLIERLRSRAAHILSATSFGNYAYADKGYAALYSEAADVLERAQKALTFYANADLYASLSFNQGPGTLPLLAADKGLIAREALTQLETKAACPAGAK